MNILTGSFPVFKQTGDWNEFTVIRAEPGQ